MSGRTLKQLAGLGVLMLALIALAGAFVVPTESAATQDVSVVPPSTPPAPPSGPSTVTGSELTERVAQRTGLTSERAEIALAGIIEEITEALKRGEKVTITGFGTFSVKGRAAQAGRNPATGETIQIPARKVPGFKAGKALKDAIN